MIELKRTNSDNPAFQSLVAKLNLYLAEINGDKHDFFMQYNNIDVLNNVIVIYKNNILVACGAIKEYDSKSMEIKRMFVPSEQRRNGYASYVLDELQKWSKELGYSKCILETSKNMTEAVALYTKHNFQVIPNYGQYANVESSVCFEKAI